MKKSNFQAFFNIVFYFLFVLSLSATSRVVFSYPSDLEAFINFMAVLLNLSIGFFHFVAYKYSNTCKHIATVIIVLSGIISSVLAYEYSYYKFEIVLYIVIWALLLIIHLFTCRFVGEIKEHEFNIKMEDGRFEKVVVKEKIKDDTNAIGPVAVIKKAVKLIAITLAVCIVLFIGAIVVFWIDDTVAWNKIKASLSDELVSSEYYENFNINDYSHVSSNISYGDTFPNDYHIYRQFGSCSVEASYYFNEDTTRLISNSETATITYDSLWQLGNDDKFIIGIDPDFGSYWLELYIKNDADLPDENNRIIKVTTGDDKVISFTDEQNITIMNFIKEFDNSSTIVETKNWDADNEGFINNYRLYFYFENYDNMKVCCCEIIKDSTGQWHIISEGYRDGETTHKLRDLEKLPQDICDTINESLK